MVSIALFALLALTALGDTWTGKIDETYTLSQLEMRPESVVYDDGYLYMSHITGQTIWKVDVDDLDKDKATTDIKESEPHDLGTSIWPIGCCEGDSDRIYCTIGNLTGTARNNGIGYWDMSSLKFKKSIVVPSTGLAADCTFKDNRVYFTAAFSGEVYVCDEDLVACTLITDSTLVKPTTFIGAMGVVHISEDDEEFLIVVNPDRGELVKVPVKDGALNGTVANVAITDSANIINGSDGLVKIADDVLISVTAENVILYETEDNWVSATIKKSVYVKTVEGADQWGGANAAVRSDDKDEIKLYVTFPGFTSFFAG